MDLYIHHMYLLNLVEIIIRKLIKIIQGTKILILIFPVE